MEEEVRRTLLEEWFREQDIWYSYDEWPQWVQEKILLKHKNHSIRWQLFTFFTLNGLHPTEAAQWIKAKSVGEDGQLQEDIYDRNAIRHLEEELPRYLKDGNLGPATMRVYDMRIGAPLPYGEHEILRRG